MNVFAAMHGLMKRPDETVAVPRSGFALFAGALACYALYGGAAGFFQGGGQIALAFWKVPLIIIGSTLLCAPSFYVFTTLAGAEYRPGLFANILGGFCGISGLILLALMPVIWLFSVTTMSLAFVVWLHALVWVMALVFGRAFLVRAVPSVSRPAVGIWLVLFFVVTLQMTTYMRPVLWRSDDSEVIELEKMSFAAHFTAVHRWTPAK